LAMSDWNASGWSRTHRTLVASLRPRRNVPTFS
jgi:hypothetical protein